MVLSLDDEDRNVRVSHQQEEILAQLESIVHSISPNFPDQ